MLYGPCVAGEHIACLSYQGLIATALPKRVLQGVVEVKIRLNNCGKTISERGVEREREKMLGEKVLLSGYHWISFPFGVESAVRRLQISVSSHRNIRELQAANYGITSLRHLLHQQPALYLIRVPIR